LGLYPTSIRKITDGTSKTLAVGERTYVPLEDWMTGIMCGLPSMICTEAAKNIFHPINSNPAQIGYSRRDPDAPTGGATLPLNHLFFGSHHPGGAQFCFADGSVHMMSDNKLDINLFKDLASRDGGEITDGAY
jgi:prepilin-type processing-associated H-X9-DG protein